LQSLEAGDVDYASLSPDQFEQLVSKDKYNIASFPDYEITVLIMNQADPKNPQPAYDKDGKPVQQTPNPIFSDVRVRQAIVMGYDKDAVLATLGDGGGTRTVASIVPTITWAVDQELKPWAYDPKRAAELLDEAGWKLNSATGIREKDGVPLKFEIIYSTFRPLYEPLATIAQDQLSQLGMDIKLTKMEFGAFVEKLVGQTFDVGVVSFGDFPPPDPNGITGLFLDSHNDVPGSGFNVASYVNPKMDALIAQGLAVPGCATEKRAPIYNQIQQLTQQDVAYDFAMASNTFYLMSKRIDGFKPGPWNQAWNLPQWTIKPS
jgi:peptide/nickel transport system substrate-binding protein